MPSRALPGDGGSGGSPVASGLVDGVTHGGELAWGEVLIEAPRSWQVRNTQCHEADAMFDSKETTK